MGPQKVCLMAWKCATDFVYDDHMCPEAFFCDKKKQRNCIRGSFLDVLLILKTLTFKSGTGSLKSYPLFSFFMPFFAYSGIIDTQPG